MTSQKQKKNLSKGYITVATKTYQFVFGAKNLCESILDYNEDAKVTLFTDQQLYDQYYSELDMFDQVIVTPCQYPDTKREKMWGMAKTPYDLTLYMDADIECRHEDINNVFDRLEGDDMRWVALKKETAPHFAEWAWGPKLLEDGCQGAPDHLSHCGGVCLYDATNSLVREFMMDWYHLYLTTGRNNKFWPEEYNDVKGSFTQWDQLTVWWLLYHSPKYKSLKWKFFDDNYRWNYYTSFGFNKDGTHNYGVVDPVLVHFSSWMDKGYKGIL